MARLEGTVAVISGAARGMGAQHARGFVAEGARVVLGDVLDAEGSAVACELGDAAVFSHLDVTDRTHWDAAVALAEQRFGPVTALVNNAGIVSYANIEVVDVDAFRRELEVNLMGALHGIQAVVPSMRRAGRGSVVNISSVAAFKGFPEIPGYVASKWGLRGLTKSAALDLGHLGIRVNSVHPGVVRTPMTDGHTSDIRRVALHRTADDGEVTPLVVFLASEESGYVTGAEFVVDGGELAGQAIPVRAS